MVVPKEATIEKDNISAYHGNGSTGNFFEGWYFKISDKNKENPFAVVLGIARSKNKKFAHTFVQILTSTDMFYYKDHDLGSFKASGSEFKFRCQDSTWDGNTLRLNTDNVKGSIRFDYFTPWPRTKYSDGVMEWTKFVPFKGLNYGVLNLNSSITGHLRITNDHHQLIDYDGGKGYIEKNWGTAFPDKYLWTQCNNFEREDVSVVASIGYMKYLGLVPLRVLVIGVYINGCFHKFTTTSLSKLKKLEVNDEKIEIVATKGSKRITVSVSRDKESERNLYAPYKNRMMRIVKESIKSEMYVKLEDLETKRVIFEGNGKNAGAESVTFDHTDDVISSEN